MSDLSIQGEVVVDSTKAESAFDRVGTAAEQMSREVAGAAGKAGQAVDKIGDGAAESASKFTRGEAIILASVRKSTEAIQLLGKTASEKLEFRIDAKGFDRSKFEPALKALREVEAQAERAQQAATGSLNKMGVSAGQTQAALRQLPAQFTDIVTSLQAGQAPLTVLIQQGGQIKDSFGGAGNALKAMSGYVMGMINPFTVAAAAVGALGFAMYSINGKESALLALSVQLKGTGRASLAAVGDIKALVNELNLIPGVSKASATAIITEFAKVSGVGGALFKQLGSSVADFAAATGTDLPTAAKKLAEAFADPAKGAKSLEEALGTLTAAQLLTIEKMAEIGNKSGAQVALMEALKQATKGLATEAMTPLGKATDDLSNAWDKMTTSVAKSEAFSMANRWLATLITSVADLTVKLSELRAPAWLAYLPGVGPAMATAINGMGVLGAASAGPAPKGSFVSGKVGYPDGGGPDSAPAPGISTSDLERQSKAALDATRAYESQASAMSKVRGDATIAKEALKALESQQRGNSVEAIELRDRLVGINEKLAEMAKKGQGAANAEQNAYQSLMATIKERIKAKQEEINFSGRLNESDKLRIQLDAQLETGAKKLTAAHKADALAQIQKLASLENIIDATKRAVTAYQEQVAIQEELNAAYVSESKAREAGRQAVQDYATGVSDTSKALELELSLMGKSEIERKTAIEQYKVELDLKKRIAAVNANQGFDQPQRDEEIGKLNAAAVQDKSNAANKVMIEDWQKTVDKYDDIFRDGFADMVNNGKEGWDAFTKSLATTFKTTVADAIYKEFIKPIVVNVVGSFMGIGGGGGGAAGGSSPLGSLFSLGSSAYQGYTGLTSGQGVLGSIGNAFGLGSGGAGLAASNAASAANGLSALQATNVGSLGGVGSGVVGQGGAYTATAAPGAGGMGALGAAGFWVAVAYAIGNAIGVNRKKELVGTGLTGTLGGADLTPWENFRKPGTLLMGPDYNRVNPLEIYEDYRKRDLEYVKTLKENGGTGTLNGSPYGNDFAATAAMGNSEYLDNIREIAASSKRQSDEVQKGYAAVRKGAVDMANGLGLAGDKLKDFTVALDPEDLNFKDLNAEQISEKIAKVFGDAGKDMAQQVLGTWITETVDVVNSTLISQLTDTTDQLYDVQVDSVTRTRYVASEYAKAGETAFETLTRLSTSFNTLNEASDALGFGIHKGSLSLANFADEFIEAFGGLERFATQTNSFLQNYYSDAERKEAGLKAAVRGAERIGLKGVTVENLSQAGKGGIREGVNSLVTNPELYGDAMEWANGIAWLFDTTEAQLPVVQELSTVVDELTQSYQNAIKSLTGDRDSLAVEVLRAQGNEAGAKALERTQYLAQFAGLDEARRKEIETLYDGNMATRAYIQGIKDAATAQLDALAKLRADSLALIDGAAGKTDAAMAAYERAADKERERLQGVIDTVRSVFQAAEDGAKSFFGEVEAVARFQGAEGRDFISRALASVQAGGALPDGKELSDAIAAVGKDFSATQFTSQAEADFQRLVVANELKGLKDASGDQLSTAEEQLEALNDQVEFARDQVNLLRGIDSSLKDLPTAIANLIAAYNAESQTRANVGAKAIIGTGNAVYDKTAGTGLTSSGAFFDASDMAEVARDVIAANGAAGKGSVLDALEGKGFTMPQYNEMFGLPPGTLEAEAKALGKPIYHSGTTYVPETGFALLQQGEAVIPAAYNPWANGGCGSNNAELVAEMRAVKAELLEIRRQNDNLGYQAKRTADATNGQGEAPALVTTV